MASSINYKDTIFDQSNLTPVHGEPTFKTIHKLQNKIKANAKAVYSNLGRGSHVHIDLVITDVQYALISTISFVYQTHLVPLILQDGTTAHANSNMWIAHTKEVRLFREVTGFEQALVQQIVATVKEFYLADIAIARKSPLMTTWRTRPLTFKKTMVSWLPTKLSIESTSPRIQQIILENRLRLYSLLSKHFLSLMTSMERCIPSPKPLT